MINKLKRKILLAYELKGIKDFNFSNEELREINKFPKIFAEIKDKHAGYIKEISSPDMAMSLELAEFLIEYCISTKPNRLIDLGSGFSSFVFRLYQKHINEQAIIYSIDDDEAWLHKTKDYLKNIELNTDNLITLDSLKAMDLNGFFDLVLLDLNFVEKRKLYISYSLDLTKEDGVTIIDDVHKVEFLREVKKRAKAHDSVLFDLKEKTIDSFGRFAILLK